jgi:ferredoxin/flavodoxin---NADP+ reductase
MSAPVPGTSDRPLRVAVVGAGPAGFYVADALTKRDTPVVCVDLFDRLPAPYGLVRYGVAPDHQKIKSVIKAYEKTAAHARVRFLGNVRVCDGDLGVSELLDHYDQIVFTVGCETDRRLGVPGEDLIGSHAATSFVAWYNGHPDFVEYPVDLSVERAAVIGVGDVAMDIARMLVQDVEELARTDIADHALEAFRSSKVREVLVIARRGPAEVAFATKELEDIAALPGVDVRIDPADIAVAEAYATELDGLARRKLGYLATLAGAPPSGASKVVRFLFFRSPAEILGQDGRVVGLDLERNRLERGPDGRVQARGTGERETEPVGLVFRSVGYRGVPLEGIPFDDRAGIIPNADGRVLQGGAIWPRVYCAGWIKRGATGVIGTNKADAADTVARMLEDLPALAESLPAEREPARLDALLGGRGVRVVTFEDWKRLDAAELREGSLAGRVRRKLLRIQEMLDALRS